MSCTSEGTSTSQHHEYESSLPNDITINNVQPEHTLHYLHHQRVVGGAAATRRWPWQVLLIDRDDERPFCSGVLIGTHHVLTAAHCFDKYVIRNLRQKGKIIDSKIMLKMYIMIVVNQVYSYRGCFNSIKRPCIHRLFPCDVCPCSHVTRHTDNEPLFCLVGTTYGYSTEPTTKVHCLCGATQGENAIRHKGTAYG